jgi:hypothetical protein
MHATPRKDMLIDATTAGQSKSVSTASHKQEVVGNAHVDGATDDGQTKVYVYYGTCSPHSHPLWILAQYLNNRQ